MNPALRDFLIFAVVAVGAFFLLRAVMRHNGDIKDLKSDVAKLKGSVSGAVKKL